MRIKVEFKFKPGVGVTTPTPDFYRHAGNGVAVIPHPVKKTGYDRTTVCRISMTGTEYQGQ